MNVPPLKPLEVNPTTGELFLRLRNHKNIILTLPRLTDAPFLPPLFNDVRVHEWLRGPPFPYTLEHAEAWLAGSVAECNAGLADLKDSSSFKLVDHCPFRAIREVNEDGSEIFLGDITILRSIYGEIMGGGLDWDRKAKFEEENSRLEAGDPNIVWTIGNYLAPSHHGKGIMSDVFGTLLNDWAIPRMGVRRMLVLAFEGNIGSVKVFEKNGFTQTRIVKDHLEAKGEMRSSHVLEWKFDAHEL